MRVLNKKYWPVSVRIDYNYDKENDIYIWCKENCQDKWLIVEASTYYFENAQDAMMFKLRWA